MLPLPWMGGGWGEGAGRFTEKRFVMATEITMPKLSDTMTEGTFGVWKKGVGDPVERGEIIAEIETDKATMELEAFASGILLEQRARTGEVIRVGAVIGIIGAPGEAVAAVPGSPVEPEAEPPRIPEAATPPPSTAPVGEEPAEHGEKAAPVVRRHARELGIDLALVEGSGPGGRVLMEDLERYIGVSLNAPLPVEKPMKAAEEPPVPPPSPQPPAAGGELSLSKMRAAIARTVEQAWQEIPHFYVTVEVRMDEAEEVRRELKKSGTPVSLNDMVVKAATMTLASFPRLNASFRKDRIVTNDEISIGIAVSLDDGLLVPVIRGCNSLSLKEIAAESRRLIERARGGLLREPEMGGGTFTISNLGMYGVSEFTAIIHPPQAGVLAVGAVQDGTMMKSGHTASARLMRVTLSADHRMVDGAYAARFLKELKRLLENPVLMLV